MYTFLTKKNKFLFSSIIELDSYARKNEINDFIILKDERPTGINGKAMEKEFKEMIARHNEKFIVNLKKKEKTKALSD